MCKLGTVKGKEYVLVITDYLTRFVVAVPVKNKKASTIAREMMKSWIAYFGWPESIITDKGTEFKGIFAELVSMYNTVHKTTTGYKPSSNGVVERFNKTMVEMLTKKLDGTTSLCWEDVVPIIVNQYNVTRHTTTGHSPFFLMLGYHPKTQLDYWIRESEHEDTEKWRREGAIEMWKALNEAKENILRKHKADKKREEEKFNMVELVVGSYVWCAKHNYTDKERGRVRKLRQKFTGPWEIIGRIGKTQYRIRKCYSTDEEVKDMEKKEKEVHVSELRNFVPRPEWMTKYLGAEEYKKTWKEGIAKNEEESSFSESESDSEVGENVDSGVNREVSEEESSGELVVEDNEKVDTGYNEKEEAEMDTEVRSRLPQGVVGERVEVRFKVSTKSGKQVYQWFVGTIVRVKRGVRKQVFVEFDQDQDPSVWVPLEVGEIRCSPYSEKEVVPEGIDE